jgi:hypothetical protein
MESPGQFAHASSAVMATTKATAIPNIKRRKMNLVITRLEYSPSWTGPIPACSYVAISDLMDHAVSQINNNAAMTTSNQSEF